MNDLKEEFTSTRIENEDSTINRLSCQVTFLGLVDGDTIDIGIIDEPNGLVGEKFREVRTGEIWFSGFRRIKLETFTNSFTKYINGRITLHDLVHSLENESFTTFKPGTISRMEVVSEIKSN